jgi:hypothetical protein
MVQGRQEGAQYKMKLPLLAFSSPLHVREAPPWAVSFTSKIQEVGNEAFHEKGDLFFGFLSDKPGCPGG